MTLMAWIVLGLIAGVVASKIVNKTGGIVIHDILLGIIGAVDGGYLFQTSGLSREMGISIYSLLVAAAGAVVVLFIYHALVRRRA